MIMSRQRNNTAEYRAELFDSATELIEREYASQLTISSVSQAIATSGRQLQRAFNEIGHTTFRDHLRKVRMQRATKLLSDPNLTITEVAKRVGYGHPNYFSQIFRSYLGIAPTMYRQINGRFDDFRWPKSWE